MWQSSFYYLIPVWPDPGSKGPLNLYESLIPYEHMSEKLWVKELGLKTPLPQGTIPEKNYFIVCCPLVQEESPIPSLASGHHAQKWSCVNTVPPTLTAAPHDVHRCLSHRLRCNSKNVTPWGVLYFWLHLFPYSHIPKLVIPEWPSNTSNDIYIYI